MTLPRRACALLCSSRAPMHACCVQNSLRSWLPIHPQTPLFGPPLTVSSLRLTAAVRTKNSSPEILTHLHYNLLGKHSSHFSLASPKVRIRLCRLVRSMPSARAAPDTFQLLPS